ncbi:hypothetical protein ABTA37_19710, partial [Acinetobacter baumannii]
TQSGSNGNAEYSQTGSVNRAILQNQVGAYGQLTVTQDATSLNSVVVAYQNSAATASVPNKIKVTQSGGSDNNAYVLQGAAFGSTLPVAGDAS